MRRRSLTLALLGAVVASLCLVPAAGAAISVLRTFDVSGLAFTLDSAGGLYVARGGGIDHYSATGVDLGNGFAVANFDSPNDIERVGTRLYAVDASLNKLHGFD